MTEGEADHLHTGFSLLLTTRRSPTDTFPTQTARTLLLPCIVFCSFAGCNVESTSVDLSVGAERTTVLKAVSEGETRFRSMAMASDTDLGFPSPDGPGRQFLAEFGEFPVYLVNRDMQV